jgi:hypothetical protein
VRGGEKQNLSGYENDIQIEKIENQIRLKLIDDDFFDPKLWRVKTLYKYPYDPDLDHSWHEYENVEITKELPTSKIDIAEFINSLSNLKIIT